MIYLKKNQTAEFELLLDSKLKQFEGKLKDVVPRAVQEKDKEIENRQTNSNLSLTKIVNKNNNKQIKTIKKEDTVSYKKGKKEFKKFHPPLTGKLKTGRQIQI